MVGTVVKAKVGELEEEIREVFSRRLRKEMTVAVQEVVGKRRYLIRFQYWLDKDMPLNQLTIVVVRSEVEEEVEVREVEMVPEVSEELGCYHWVYIYLHFIDEYGIDKRGEQVGVDPDPDEE